ncbi:Shedu anti-phage system protein SduA domain-containing protein [Mucilaginibacter sp. AW1-7]|uniref:Shedu anti-phage system protein SduA domain-containing protein n=1 Tax=Mucilaginibacter sp. AW1-7 TaxID=3349874 RepID=UPI003F73B101
MQLNEFQTSALEQIKKAYDSSRTSALLIMPAGTGKTTLSRFIIEDFAKEFNIKSFGYFSGTKILKQTFESVIEESVQSDDVVIKVYTYQELNELIDNKLIKTDEFEVLIFDDVDEAGFYVGMTQKIYSYFSGFKIGFSRSTLNHETKSVFKVEEGGIIILYSLDQAVNDGYFFSSQEAWHRHFLGNFRNYISHIGVGVDWNQAIKQRLLKEIDIVSSENDEYLKVQKILLSGKINTAEILEMSHRKEQLLEFNRLLTDKAYFDKQIESGKGTESVWQKFFEDNPWIFGFGLNYIFNAPLSGRKLEQTVAGYSVAGHGKRTDALLKTTGLIQTLCFGEIKTHRKSILKDTLTPYRSSSWAISDELAGGIAQVQRTVQKSLMNIAEALSMPDEDGYKSKNPVYLYKPKSFLIIGSLDEFRNENGDIHEDKFSSFELFRRSVNDVEIITFDELYERADAIVNKKWNIDITDNK